MRSRAGAASNLSRRVRTDDGWNLVELMVVLCVIGVLGAVAVPTLLGARNVAHDHTTQAAVHGAVTAMRLDYGDRLTYTSDVAELAKVERAIDWTDVALDPGTAVGVVRVGVADWSGTDQVVVLSARSASGRCYYARDVQGGTQSVTYASVEVDSAAACPDLGPAEVTGYSWSNPDPPASVTTVAVTSTSTTCVTLGNGRCRPTSNRP